MKIAFVPPPGQEALALLVPSDQDLMGSSGQGINFVLANLNIMPYIDCSYFRYRDALFAAESRGALSAAESRGTLSAAGLIAAGSRSAQARHLL